MNIRRQLDAIITLLLVILAVVLVVVAVNGLTTERAANADRADCIASGAC